MYVHVFEVRASVSILCLMVIGIFNVACCIMQQFVIGHVSLCLKQVMFDIFCKSMNIYSSTCHERTPSGPSKSVRTLQVAARDRDGLAGGGRQM